MSKMSLSFPFLILKWVVDLNGVIGILMYIIWMIDDIIPI